MGFIAQVYSPYSRPVDKPEDKSVWGFVKNVPGEVGEMLQGLSALGGMVLNDVAGGVQWLAADKDSRERENIDFHLDDAAKTLDDLAKQYKDIYMPGGEKLGDYIYENPLSFIGDIATVLTLGGAGVAKGAQAASKVGGVASALDDVARGASAVEDLSGLAKFVSKVNPGRIQAVPEGWKKVGLGGYRPVLDTATGTVRNVARSNNPARRLTAGAINRALTTSIDDVSVRQKELLERALAVQEGRATKVIETDEPAEGLAGKLGRKQVAEIPADEGLAGGSSVLAAESETLERLVDAARKAGVTRIDKPWVHDFKVRRASDKLFGYHTSKYIKNRNDYMKEADVLLSRFVTGMPAKEGQLFLDNFHRLAQTVSTKSAGRITFDDIPEAIRQAHASGDQELIGIADAIQPHLDRYAQMQGTRLDPQDFVDPEQGEVDVRRYLEANEKLDLEKKSARAYIENLTEAMVVARKADATPEQRALAEMRLWVDQRLSNPLMARTVNDRPLLSYTTAMDRAYQPHRYEQVDAIRESMGDIPDEELARHLDEAGHDPDATGFGAEFNDQAVQQNMSAPLYFPHIDGRRVKFMDFLLKRSSRAMAEGTKPFLKKWGGHLMENGAYITDPKEVYARRAAQVTKYMETMDLIEEVVKKFGVPIKWGDDIDPETQAVFSLTSNKLMFHTKMTVEDKLSQAVLREAQRTDGDLVHGDTKEADAFADGLVSAFKLSHRKAEELMEDGAQLYAIPKVVADRLDNYTKLRLNWRVRMFWDAPVNLWRSFVLAGSPRWVLYNLLGNITFLKMQGGKLSQVARYGASKAYKKVMSKFFKREVDGFSTRVDELVNAAPDEVKFGLAGGYFSSSHQNVTHYGPAENTSVAQFYRYLQQKKPAKWGRNVTHFMQGLNQSIEEAFRKVSFLHGMDRRAAQVGMQKTGMAFWHSKERLRKLAGEGFDADTARAALDEVNKFFNDYNALGPWERNVIRRFISPFYSFYKHIVTLAVRFPIESPVRFSVMSNLAKWANEENDIGPVPSWLKGAVPTNNFDFLGGTASPTDTRFISARGMNPFAPLVGDPEDFVMGQLSFPLKMLYERATGRSTLTGEPFTSPDVFSPFGSDERYRVNPDGTVESADRVVPTFWEHLGQQIPQYQLLRDLAAPPYGGGARYGTGELINYPGTNMPRYPRNQLQELLQFFGISTTDYDLLNYQLDHIAGQRDALKQAARLNPSLFLGG